MIVSLNREEIDSADKFASVASKLPDSGFVPIRIVREGQGTTMALELNPYPVPMPCRASSGRTGLILRGLTR